jgi:1,2-diacylglycerol 3-beta-galactosyltransferase
MSGDQGGPVPLLFLIGDTGGGHRSAASAVSQALHRRYPGRFAPVICDPLRGPGTPLRLRWMVSLYGPCIRLTPWLWGLLWRSLDSPGALAWSRRTLFSPASRSVARLVAEHQPAVIVSFHAMTTHPAVQARDTSLPGVPVVTVITDLITTHLAWRDASADRIVVPSAPVGRRCAEDGTPEGHYVELGLPVGPDFAAAPEAEPDRRALQRALALPGRQFLVVMTGGAEGSGGLYRRARAILRHLPGVDVAVICGRNRRLRRRLDRLAARTAGRLAVRGFVDNMADWLRCADVVVGKAGPGTIAEAACCSAPLVLTSFVPGQEAGNAGFVTTAGAGRYAPRRRDLVTEIGSLLGNPATLAAMRAAAASLARPEAADDIAALLAGLVSAAERPPADAGAGPERAAAGHRPPPLRAGRPRARAALPLAGAWAGRGQPGRSPGDPAVFQPDHPVGQGLQPGLVGDQDEGATAPPGQQVSDEAFLGRGVEARGRLIEQ